MYDCLFLCEGILNFPDVREHIASKYPGLISQMEEAVRREKAAQQRVQSDGAKTCDLYGCSNLAVVKVCAEHYVPTCPVCKQPYEGYGICINCAGDV
jgi:hypothetical protein